MAASAAGDDGNLDGEADTVAHAVFTSYRVGRNSLASVGRPHPGDIAEPTSLSSVQLPPTDYPLLAALPGNLVHDGLLSQLQLEGALYAASKHQQILPNGQRAGFFIGDGAGVGKGRQIAAVILDNYVRGRKKHVWLSISSDLRLDAERDFKDLGAHLTIINNLQTLDKESRGLGLSATYQQGVLFMTYSTLTASGGKDRLAQAIAWLGGEAFEGCLVFDECHKAKNFVAGKEGSSTKVSKAVIDLQERLPRARVLYCSATGVSEVGHMAYMGGRMGLWGSGTPFPDFQAFLDTMKRRGVSFLEMLAMEMKAEGKYVARGLSFRDAEFGELVTKLEPEQVAMYNAAAGLWRDLSRALASALVLTHRQPKEVMTVFWSSQQRFFKLLCVSLKVPTVVAEARAALHAGQCVVIGLQTTGEAADSALGLEPGPVPGFVSTTKEMLVRFVQDHFPITRLDPREKGEGPPAPSTPPVVVPQCVEARDELLARIRALRLPPNFLDAIIDELGGTGQVAEMTGRKGRIVRKPPARPGARATFAYELRAKPDSGDMESLNIREKELFNAGKRLVAIISDAASTGISLHASRSAGNQRRRVHLTIELPWSADKAIQQLGRSHRSNQVSGPLYKLISTTIGGEKRFAAAVARRLQSLGALTRGDRRAASGIDLSEQNFDSPLGRRALRRMYDAIVLGAGKLPPGVSLTSILKEKIRGEVGRPDMPDEEAEALAELQDPSMAEDAIRTLHSQLREYVDVMGVGGAGPRAPSDTTAEDLSAAGAAGGIAASGSASLADKGASGSAAKDAGDVRRFLNRLLGLPVAQQAVLFAYFVACLEAEVAAARRDGKFSEGLSDLPSNLTSSGAPRVLWREPLSGLTTIRHDFTLDRGFSFQAALLKLEHEAGGAAALAAGGGVLENGGGFRRSRRPQYGTTLVALALLRPGTRNTFTLYRPNTGQSFLDVERSELDQRYVKVAPEAIKEAWDAAYTSALERCVHGAECKQGTACSVGKRLTGITVLSGSVVRVWGVLESVLARHELELSRAERIMRVVRVQLPGSTPKPASTQPTPSKAVTGSGTLADTGLEGEGGTSSQGEDTTELEIVSGGAEDLATTLPPVSDDAVAAVSGSAGNANAAGPDVHAEHIVGVRYPAFLLPEVVATLQLAAQQAAGPAGSGGAAAIGSNTNTSGICVEPPTPVVPSLKTRAFLAPKTITDFYSKAPRQGPAGRIAHAPSDTAIISTSAPTNTTGAVAASTASKPVPSFPSASKQGKVKGGEHASGQGSLSSWLGKGRAPGVCGRAAAAPHKPSPPHRAVPSEQCILLDSDDEDERSEERCQGSGVTPKRGSTQEQPVPLSKRLRASLQGPVGEVTAAGDAVAALEGMGFTRTAAWDALRKAGGDMQQAIELCLQCASGGGG